MKFRLSGGQSLAVVLFCLIGLHASFNGLRAAWADLNTLVSRLTYENPSGKPGQRAQLRQNFQAALALTSDNPYLHEALGQLTLEAGGLGADSTARQTAKAAYLQALALRPMSPYTWAQYAELAAQLGEQGEFLRAFELAQQYGPRETVVQWRLARLACEHWDQLSPATRVLLKHQAPPALALAKQRGKDWPLPADCLARLSP